MDDERDDRGEGTGEGLHGGIGTGGSEPRPGLPWERRDEFGIGAAIVETMRLVLLSPARAFREMRRLGGFADPLGYAVLLGSVGAWFGLFWQMLVRSLGVEIAGGGMMGVAAQNVTTVVWAAVMPLIILVALVIWAGIVHALLVVFGGARYPWETTLRVLGYATGSTAVFQLIPLCGGLIALVWGLVVEVIGLTAAQEVPTGRAAAAVLVPLVLVCCCLALIGMFTAGFMAMMAQQMG